MAKTVLITGASSGIGRATAELFARRGWNVVATMRDPGRARALTALAGVKLLPLDVTEPESIAQAVAQAIASCGRIDVLVNNAGYALMGPFEAATPEQIERQYATNVFGLMHVTRALLPHLREKGGGTIVNVASIGGRLTFPLYSLYHGTKWAVEGFSEALQFEVEPFNIRVKLIEPGPIRTDFYDRSMDLVSQPGLTAYDAFIRRALPTLQQAGRTAPGPEAVAKTILKAATDSSKRLRYPVNAALLLTLRRLLPEGLFLSLIRAVVVRG